MKEKDPITEEIKKARTQRGLSALQLAEILEVPVDRVYKWEQGKGAPKYEDRKKVQAWLTGKDWNNVPRAAKEPGKAQASGDAVLQEGDFVKAIIALTESNKGLVETNLTVTSTNQVIADTNALLAQKLVDQNPTAIEDRHTFDETVAMVIALRESLIELSSHMKKISPREASQEFHNKVKVAKGKIDKKDSRVDAGK